MDGDSGPFNGISVARGVTNARTPLSDRIPKGWRTFENLVVLYT